MNVDLIAFLSKLCNDVQRLTGQDQNSGYCVCTGGPVAVIEPGVCANQDSSAASPCYLVSSTRRPGAPQNLAAGGIGELVGRKPETEQGADKGLHRLQRSRSAVNHTAHVSSH